MRLEEFKAYCIDLNADIMVQKYLIENETYFFKEIREGGEFEFKKDIAEILGIHVRDVVIVGSSKLGFSLKPEEGQAGLYLFKEFDCDYKKSDKNEKSDLDVAVVSSFLFDKEIKNLFDHTLFYKKPWEKRNSLAQYVLKGRLATRFFPLDFLLSKEIEKVQEKYKMEYGRVVNIEIYKSWYFFEKYHQENIQNIHLNLIR